MLKLIVTGPKKISWTSFLRQCDAICLAQIFYPEFTILLWRLSSRVQQLPSNGFYLFFQMGQPRPLFHLFSSFQTHIRNYTTKIGI